MKMTAAIASFKASINSGESRRSAHESVRAELDDYVAEANAAGLPTEGALALLQQWDELDYRTIA